MRASKQRMAYPSITTRQRGGARKLRREHTDAEQKLWQQLRARQVGSAKFRRQQPIGPYFADFCSVEHRLVVEVDGGQHAETREADKKRTLFLEGQGFRVLRFWDHEVLKEMQSVLERIAEVLKSPHPNPLPGGEGVRRQR